MAMTPDNKNLWAVVAGLLVITAAGLLYLPFEYMIAEKYLDIFKPRNTTHDIIYVASVVGYALLPTFCGGWATAAIAADKPVFRAFITGILTLVILSSWYIARSGFQFEITALIFVLITVAGTWLGGLFGQYRKNKRTARKPVA